MQLFKEPKLIFKVNKNFYFAFEILRRYGFFLKKIITHLVYSVFKDKLKFQRLVM